MTLEELYLEHPEWRTLPLVVHKTEGTYDYVGAAGDVYEGVGDEGEPVVVFAAN